MILDQLFEAVVKGDQKLVPSLVEQALGNGLEPQTVLNDGLIKGMTKVGEKFQSGEYFIPHMLLAARAMNAALEILKPRLAETGAEPVGKVIMGTVKGDHHDIGKNLVTMMLKGKGFEVIDIGINVPPEKFVEAVTDDIRIVGMCSLLPPQPLS